MTNPKPVPSPTEAAATLAHFIFDHAPRGRLTLLNGRAITPYGGWAAIAAALSVVTDERRGDMTVYDLAGGNRFGDHPMSVALSDIGDACFVPWDLNVTVPGEESPFADTYNGTGDFFNGLPDELLAFASAPSITAAARCAATDGPGTGQWLTIFVDVAHARPYAEIARRQQHITDSAARHAALNATYEWLADDLVTFAASRPTEPTIIVSADDNPEWATLTERDSLILPAALT